jgi:octaprenyl-diphosphate synthase
MIALHAVPRANELALGKSLQLDRIVDPVSEDLVSVGRHINEQLTSDVALIRQMGAYLIAAGGKQLRPITLLLASKALNYRGTDHIALAAVIELIHTATLMHDDVVDNSELRRGQRTGNAVWGNTASVLVGDFMYSRSFEMMVTVNRMRVMEIMASTTNAIAEGEVMQLLHLNSPDIKETEYLATIERKTARLFQSATQLAAVLSGADAATEKALSAFGLNLGIAFQIADDLLDYGPPSLRLGKNPGDDLAEGKCTLPLIHALKNGNYEEQRILHSAIKDGDQEKFHAIQEIIESTGSVEYTARCAQEYAVTAKSHLKKLPESIYLASLRDLADFSASRLH